MGDVKKVFHKNVSTSKEGIGFCELLIEIIDSMPPEQAQRINNEVFFIVASRRAFNAKVIPMVALYQAVIVFMPPFSKPLVEVIAHELGHFLNNHHIRDRSILGWNPNKLSTGGNPEFEKEADKTAKKIIEGYERYKKSNPKSAKSVLCDRSSPEMRYSG